MAGAVGSDRGPGRTYLGYAEAVLRPVAGCAADLAVRPRDSSSKKRYCPSFWARGSDAYSLVSSVGISGNGDNLPNLAQLGLAQGRRLWCSHPRIWHWRRATSSAPRVTPGRLGEQHDPDRAIETHLKLCPTASVMASFSTALHVVADFLDRLHHHSRWLRSPIGRARPVPACGTSFPRR